MAKPSRTLTFYIAAPIKKVERICVEGGEPNHLYGCGLEREDISSALTAVILSAVVSRVVIEMRDES